MKKNLTLYKTYSLSFDVYFNQFRPGEHESIIRLTNTNENHVKPGDRVVGVWTYKTDSSSSKPLYIARAGGFFVTNTFYSLKQWIHVDIRQVLRDGRFSYIVTINNKKEHEVENKDPKVHKDLVFYTSDRFYEPAFGVIRKIKITSG